MEYDRYQKFRQQTYQMLGKAKDSTFELMDSVMTTRKAHSLPHLMLVVWQSFLSHPCLEENGIVLTKLYLIAVLIEIN